MAEMELPQPSMTVAMIMDERNRGKNFREIAEKFSITPEEAYRLYTEYIESSHALNEMEYRALQLQRLEKMIDAVWDLAINNNSLDGIDSLLSILREINKMLGLNKQKAEVAVQVIDARQQTLIINYVDVLAETLLQRVLATVTSAKAKTTIEQNWDDWIAEASARPLEIMSHDTVKV